MIDFVLKIGQILMNLQYKIDHTSKNKNRKINFYSIRHCANIVTSEVGGVCISLVRKHSMAFQMYSNSHQIKNLTFEGGERFFFKSEHQLLLVSIMKMFQFKSKTRHRQIIKTFSRREFFFYKQSQGEEV